MQVSEISALVARDSLQERLLRCLHTYLRVRDKFLAALYEKKSLHVHICTLI